MKKNVDDSTMEMVDWPFLLPHDFVPWVESLTFFSISVPHQSQKQRNQPTAVAIGSVLGECFGERGSPALLGGRFHGCDVVLGGHGERFPKSPCGV